MIDGSHDGWSRLEALGLLSIGEPGPAYAQRRAELLRLAECLPAEDRTRIASYLRRGTIVFAAMEHTRDVIGGDFETPGGSGILTDGEYYWRLDAADYVEHYGLCLPADFVDHVARLNWVCPEVPPERVLVIDRILMSRRLSP